VQKPCDESFLKQPLAFFVGHRCSCVDVQLGRDILLTKIKKHQVYSWWGA